MSWLYGQFCNSETDSCEDIYYNLLRHRIVYITRKHGVATNKTGDEGVVVSFFACGRGMSEKEHGGLVDKGEEGKVAGVLASGLKDEPTFRAESM